MAGTVGPASPLAVPETDRIAALLAGLAGRPPSRPTVFGEQSATGGSSTLRLRKPAPRADRPPNDPRLEPLGRELGRRLADLFPYPGGSPTERLNAAVRAAFRHLGWDEPGLDLGRSAENVIIVQVQPGPADGLVFGALAGLLSQLAGVDMAAAPMRVAGEARLFVVGPPERLEGVRG